MWIEQLKGQIPGFVEQIRAAAGERDRDPRSDCNCCNGNRRRRGDDVSGGRGGEIRSLRHGDEQRLLPFRSSRFQSRIQDNARSAAHELARQSPVDRADFELWALAVSAINGSGACNAHEKTLRQVGASLGYNSNRVGFAAIVQSAAVAIEAARHGTSQRAE